MITLIFRSQLRRNMVSGTATHSINIVVLGLSYPIYLHYLGYEKYGLWLALGAVLALVRLSDLGMAQALMKLVAEQIGRGHKRSIPQYVATSLLVLCAAGGIAFTILFVFRSQIISAFRFTGESHETAMWLLPCVALLSFYSVVVQSLVATLSGLGRMDLSNYTETGRRMVLFLVAVLFLHFGFGIKSLLIATAFSYLVQHLAILFLIRIKISYPIIRLRNIKRYCITRLLQTGTGLFGGSVLQMVGMPFNRLLLARYAGVESLPILNIAWEGSLQFQLLFGVAMRALMPEVSQVWNEMTNSSLKRIRMIISRSIRFVFAAATPVFLVLFLFAELLLRVWLSKSFVNVIPSAFRVMLLGAFVSLLGRPAYHFLVGSGRVGNAFVSLAITWIGGILLVFSYSVYFQELTPFVICACSCFCRLVSSFFLMCRLHTFLSHDEERIASSLLLPDRVTLTTQGSVSDGV